MRLQFRNLRYKREIHAADFPTLRANQRHSFFNEEPAGRALPLGIIIRKMHTDVSKSCRSEQRVRERMQQDVCVRVALQAAGARNFNSAQHEAAIMTETMRIESNARTDSHHSHPCVK